MNTILNYVLYFFAYSALGWFIESVYVSIAHRKITNRGFLKGPMCPIYGTGALVMLVSLEPIANCGKVILSWDIFKTGNPIVITSTFYLVVLVGMIVCDSVEYVTSVIMEKLFHARWWDYSTKKFNLHGRICLRHTLYWGLMSFLFVYSVHPFIERHFFIKITEITSLRNYFLIGVFIIFIIDVILSAITAANAGKFISRINELSDTVSLISDGLKTNIEMKYEELIKKTKEQFNEIKSFGKNDNASKKEKKTAKNIHRMFDSVGNIKSQVTQRIEKIEKWFEEHK